VPPRASAARLIPALAAPTASPDCGGDLRVVGEVVSELLDMIVVQMKALQPLIERIEADIMGRDLLHADDTPICVLDRSLRDSGLGEGVKKGRIWTYVRDHGPWAPP